MTAPPKEISRWECPSCGAALDCGCAYNGGYVEVWYISKADHLAAVAAEREACARVAEESQNSDNWNSVKNVADQIRARGEGK